MASAVHKWLSGFEPRRVINIEEIELPDELTCAICLVVFPRHHFAKAQLNLIRATILKEGPHILLAKHLAKCHSCSHKSNIERKCRMCRKWKSIDCYARVQRNLESPLCMRCQDWIQQEEWKKNHPLSGVAALENSEASVGSELASGEYPPFQPPHALLGQSDMKVNAIAQPSREPNVQVSGALTHPPRDLSLYVPGAESASEDEHEETAPLDTCDYL